MISKEKISDYIFISYSHDDIEFARKLEARLTADGYESWIDLTEIHAREEFSAEIQMGIDRCSIFLSLISKTYGQKEFCKNELAYAGQRKRIKWSAYIDEVELRPEDGLDINYHRNILGYNRKIITEEDFENFYRTLTNEIDYFYAPKDPHWVESNIDINRLRSNFEGIYPSEYVSEKIYTELYPDFSVSVTSKDEESGEKTNRKKTFSTDNNNEALIDYIESNSKSHIFIEGAGGSGKTVALKNIFNHFAEKGIPAIYVPLIAVNFKDGLEKYMEEISCQSAGWNNIKQLALKNEYIPRVVLILDGLNEVTEDIKEVIKAISQKMLWANMQVIVTSRINYLHYFSDNFDIKHICLTAVSESAINNHLENKGMAPVKNERLLYLLSNPMMLTLYTEAKINSKYIKNLEKYDFDYSYFPIRATETPDTAGKIIWNYLVSQLYKATRNGNSKELIHNFFVVEIFLPLLAYNCVVKGEGLSLDFYDCCDDVDDFKETAPYDFYARRRIRGLKAETGVQDIDFKPELLINIAKNMRIISFNNKTQSVVFCHQIFRDFFAALFIAKQIELLACGRAVLKDYAAATMSRCIYSEFITDYASDILCEADFTPVVTTDGIFYPKQSDESYSYAERALNEFRNKEGDDAQTAVVNLFEIMKTGRGNGLSRCDFSNLDLRLCDMKNVRFVEWYKNEVYPSRFDGAWMSIESFIKEGHDSSITAICTDNERLIFSGDESGIVKIFDTAEHKCKKTLEFCNEKVTDLAWHSETKRLAVMYKKSIYLYSYDNGSFEFIKNESPNGDFRYVGFDEKGELTVSYSLEPLTLKYLSGENTDTVHPRFDYDVPARCAKWNPKRTEFARSRLMQAITVTVMGENGHWWLHDEFKKNIVNKPLITEEEQLSVRKKFEAQPKPENFYCSKIFDRTHRIACSYLINTGRDLYVYNEKRKKITHKLSFTCDIERIYNVQGQITVELARTSVLLKPDLTIDGAYLSLKEFGARNRSVVNCMTYSEDGSRLLIGIQNRIIEFETESLNVVRTKSLDGTVGAVCYFADKVIASSAAKIYILNEDFSENMKFDSGNTSEIKYYIEDWDGDGCYILAGNGTIKKLNKELEVQRIRRVQVNSKFLWAKDMRSGKVVLFSKMKGYSHGGVVDLETGESKDPLWNYELLERFFYDDYENTYYTVGNRIFSYQKTPPFKMLTFKNYSGVHIYGCSFVGIKGNISSSEGQSFIRQNGGFTNGGK